MPGVLTHEHLWMRSSVPRRVEGVGTVGPARLADRRRSPVFHNSCRTGRRPLICRKSCKTLVSPLDANASDSECGSERSHEGGAQLVGDLVRSNLQSRGDRSGPRSASQPSPKCHDTGTARCLERNTECPIRVRRNRGGRHGRAGDCSREFDLGAGSWTPAFVLDDAVDHHCPPGCHDRWC